MNAYAAALDLVRAVDQLRVLKRAGRDEPVDAYRVQCARDRFDGGVVLAIGAAVMTGEIPIDNDRPEWVTPTPIGPPPPGWAER